MSHLPSHPSSHLRRDAKVHEPASASSAPAHAARPTLRGPIRRDEYVRRVREALGADYVALHNSPLCTLPGVTALAQTQFARKIFPEAAALHSLLDRACALALEEVDSLEDKRAQQVATYLRLARQHLPVAEITRQLGLHSRSYVHTTIQRQALDLVTEAFLKSARGDDNSMEVTRGLS